MKQVNRIYLTFSIVISILILISGSAGIFSPRIYDTETFNWQTQAVWQDYIDVLFIIPVLLISGLLAGFGKVMATLIWTGAMVYICYTYTIFCFDVHFNSYFVAYCLIWGLSFYACAWFFYSTVRSIQVFTPVSPLIRWFSSLYVILLGCSFYLLWLMELLPASVLNTVPKNIADLELFTNPVHVLDLGIILPAFIISGILAACNYSIGRIMISIMLTFSALMSFTIAGLQAVLYIRRLESTLVVSYVMFVMFLIDLVLLKLNNGKGWTLISIKHLAQTSSPKIHST